MGEDNDEPQGFRITDKRRRPGADEKAEAKAEAKVLGQGAGVHIGSADDGQPPIDFGSFALSLAHSVLVDLGVVEHPELGATGRDLDGARQTIQILEMLQEKTRNNLDPEEEKLLGSLLYELRMAYVEASTHKVETGS